jgi:hypothetical protein
MFSAQEELLHGACPWDSRDQDELSPVGLSRKLPPLVPCDGNRFSFLNVSLRELNNNG